MSLRRTASPLLVGLAMLAGVCGVHAAPDLQVSGFATLGAVYTRSDDLQFARVGIDAPGGDRIDLGPDSVLGLQLGLQFGQGTGAGACR